MKADVQDFRSHLYHTVLLDVENNEEDEISSIQTRILGLWCCYCHLLLENAPCIAVVSEAKSVLGCESSWFPGWKIKRTWGQDSSPHWASISLYI